MYVEETPRSHSNVDSPENCPIPGLTVAVINCLQTHSTLGGEACPKSFEVLYPGEIRCGSMQIFCKKSFSCLPFIRTAVMSVFTQHIFLLDLFAKSERPEKQRGELLCKQVPTKPM